MSRVAEDNRPSGGDVCGPWTNLNFGNPFSTTTVNPDVLHGWGIRPYDWQFGVSIQHELLPRVSVDVGYNRRWWGNHFFTDNRAIGPQDFDTATITAPGNRQPAERRRLSRDVRDPQLPFAARRDRQLLHVRRATTATSPPTGTASTSR